MLKQRVFTALLLLPLVMAAIFALPAQWFMVLLIFVFMQGCNEYKYLAGFSGQISGPLLVALQGIILLALFWYRDNWDAHILIFLSASCAAWLLMFIRLPLYNPDAQADNSYRAVSIVCAVVSITTGWFAIGWIRMQEEGSWLILLFLLIVWAADTGAYFAGKTFGKNKLAPRISPGKTKVGFLGGLIAAPLVALLAAKLMPLTSIEPTRLFMLGLVTALVSVGGDLEISLHKRTSGRKDSSNLLPGHGGVLDRIDSLLAAARFFALCLMVSDF